jgi:putative FmdB family regulatory protein
MPLREYQCEECSAEWEELRRDQTDPPQCPNCGEAGPIHRKISTGSFQFKHGGFSSGYTTKSN